MSAGVLQFSLGLTAGGFMGVLDKATSKVGGLSRAALSLPGLGTALGGAIASVSSLHAMVEGVFGAIERGAALEHLSKRTDTTVESLFKLQKGFKAAGLDAENVGPMIFKMQKALGGVNEYGEDTKSIFFRMGLSIEQLKKLKAPEQFQQIAAALGKLNSSSAANAASTIFGREGAGNMVQLSRSTAEFSEAMKKAQADAELFARNAASFAKLERGLNSLKAKTQTLFAGMAEGAAPAIQMVVDMFNKIDLTAVGRKIGRVFTAFTQAFKTGGLTELLSASLAAAFETAGYYGARIFATLAAGLGHAVGSALYIAFSDVLPMLWNGINNAAKLAASVVQQKTHISMAEGYEAEANKINKAGHGDDYKGAFGDDFSPKELREKAAKERALAAADAQTQSQLLNQGTADFRKGIAQAQKDLQQELTSLFADIQKTWADSADPNRPHAAQDKLAALIDKYSKMVVNIPDEPDKTGKGNLDLTSTKSGYKFEATSLEKMGFVMGGLGNPLKRSEELLLQIVNNTRPGKSPAPAVTLENKI